MDLLHRKISKVDDQVFFIVSSIEEPYYFVRFTGVVVEISVTETTISYRIRANRILESSQCIRDCICNKQFRMKCIRRKTSHYLDKIMRCVNITDTDLSTTLIKRMANNLFDLSIMQTFLTETDMNEHLSRINQYNIDKLSTRVDYLSKRNAVI